MVEGSKPGRWHFRFFLYKTHRIDVFNSPFENNQQGSMQIFFSRKRKNPFLNILFQIEPTTNPAEKHELGSEKKSAL